MMPFFTALVALLAGIATTFIAHTALPTEKRVYSSKMIFNGSPFVDPKSIQGSGIITTVTYNTNLFLFTAHKVVMDIPGNLIIQQGKYPALSIETDDNIQDCISAYIKDEAITLFLQSPPFVAHVLTARLTLPRITAVAIEGMGGIHLQGALKTDTLSISHIGVKPFTADSINTKSLDIFSATTENITIDQLQTESLTAKIAGTGNVTIRQGSTKTHRIEAITEHFHAPNFCDARGNIIVCPCIQCVRKNNS